MCRVNFGIMSYSLISLSLSKSGYTLSSVSSEVLNNLSSLLSGRNVHWPRRMLPLGELR